MTAPLDGVLVIDLTRYGPGPWGVMLLADLGADVIKVEPPTAGIDRQRGRLVGEGGMFADHMDFCRRGSRSITLDLKNQDGLGVMLQLCDRADVLVESFRPGAATRLGIGPEQLLERNPRLVYCSISGYGQDGPAARRAGHDINYIATAGLLSATRGRGGEPVLPGTVIADFVGGGMQAVIGVLGALRARDTHGAGGQHVDVSMQEGIAQLMAPMVVEYLETGYERRPPEGYLYGMAPWYNLYETSDGGHVAVAAVEPWFFANLCEVLGHPEWTEGHLDRDAWPALKKQVAEVFRSKTRDEWAAAFRDVDACVTPVYDFSEVPTDDQLAHRRMFQRRANDAERWEPAPLPRLSETPLSVRRPVPVPGENTDEVLAELGYDDEERARLRASGALG